MKHKGSTGDYIAQRNRELLKAFDNLDWKTVTRTSADNTMLMALCKASVKQKASRFYVGEQRAAIVVGRMLRGETLEGMTPSRRRMYAEIYRRFLKMRVKDPALRVADGVSAIVNQPAPEFYLSADRMMDLYYKGELHKSALRRN